MINYKLYDVLIAPMYSEKSTMNTQFSKYTFKVSKTATKPLIKKAFKELFDTEVLNINILNTKSKKKIFKGVSGVRSGYKKAVITVQKGKTLEFISGV